MSPPRLMVQPFMSIGNDCGVFVAFSILEMAAAFLDNDRKPKFPDQDQIFQFRHQMAEEILDALDQVSGF